MPTQKSFGFIAPWGLAGGWPGALVAQELLRHKTRKREFRVVFRATVVLNCAGFVWLLTPMGRNAIAHGAGMSTTLEAARNSPSKTVSATRVGKPDGNLPATVSTTVDASEAR